MNNGNIIFKKPIIVCFGGPPFSGKDEHGKRFMDFIYENTSVPRVLSYDNGQGLRDASKDESLTEHMRNILSKSMNTDGKTVQAMITIRGLTEFLFKNNDAKTHFVLKGLFRNPEEPSLFVDFTNEYFPAVKKYFIRLNIPEDVIRQRFKEVKRSGRVDDEKDKLEKRIMAYRHTHWVYSGIKKRSDFIFFDVDGNKDISDVQENIRNMLTSIHVTLERH